MNVLKLAQALKAMTSAIVVFFLAELVLNKTTNLMKRLINQACSFNNFRLQVPIIKVYGRGVSQVMYHTSFPVQHYYCGRETL